MLNYSPLTQGLGAKNKGIYSAKWKKQHIDRKQLLLFGPPLPAAEKFFPAIVKEKPNSYFKFTEVKFAAKV